MNSEGPSKRHGSNDDEAGVPLLLIPLHGVATGWLPVTTDDVAARACSQEIVSQPGPITYNGMMS